MGAGCCGAARRFDGASAAYRRVLSIIIALNGTMFAVETAAGHFAGSQALQADALDFLGDAVTYGLSLAVIGRPAVWRTSAALFKGISLAVLALWVIASTLWQLAHGGVPEPVTMSLVGVLALAVNVAAALLLFRFRDGDANVRSVWLCSRNDAIGNIAVMLAAAAVWISGSAWPDLVVALGMASLFLHSSGRIVQQALHEHQQDRRARAAATAR